MAIIGGSGSGKSTLAARLGGDLGLPVIELDALNWGPDWFDRSRKDPEDLVRRVEAAIAGDGWVIDGNYRVVLPHILRRATDLIWLDYSRAVAMPRVIRRSFRRAISSDELWPGTGNREDFRRWFSKDHPIRWAWDTYAERRRRYAALFADPALSGLTLHRLRHPRDAEALLERWLEREQAPPNRFPRDLRGESG